MFKLTFCFGHVTQIIAVVIHICLLLHVNLFEIFFYSRILVKVLHFYKFRIIVYKNVPSSICPGVRRLVRFSALRAR